MNRWLLYRLPIIGHLLPSPTIAVDAGGVLYGVRHPRFALWISDPYGRHAGDPAASWAAARRAWRFGTIEQAEQWRVAAAVAGTVEPLPMRR